MRERPAGAASAHARGARRHARKAIVLLNRRGWSNFLSCRSCGRVWECPSCDVTLVLHRGAGAARLPPLRPPRARAVALPGLRRRCRSRATARGPSGSSTSCRVGVPVVPARRRRARRRAPSLARVRGRRRAASSSARRWSPRATTSPTSTLGVVARRRRDAALPRLPRRGADVRARRRSSPAGPAAARRAAGCSSRRSRPTRRRSRSPRSHDADAFLAGRARARREALRYPPFSTLIRIVCSAPEAAGRRGAGGARAAAAARCARGSTAPRAPPSARRRCSACAAASAARSSSRRRDRRAAVRRDRRGGAGASRPTGRRGA